MNTPGLPLSSWAPLLLAEPSPCLRWRVLHDLFGRPEDDPELQELAQLREADPLVTELVEFQAPDGSWREGALEDNHRLIPTSVALMRLAFLGFKPEHPAVQRGAEYLFSHQLPDGAWPLVREKDSEEGQEGYSMIPLQTALPLRALAMCGYAQNRHAEHAYDWLLAQRLPDGAWPTGIASGNYGYVGGYRRMLHSRWGCRSNTTGALACLALHPTRCSRPEARQALDLLLGRETRERHTLGFEVARLAGAEPARGFITFYARFDLAQILDLCARIGVSMEDPRLKGIVEFVLAQRGSYGLWDYAAKPQVSRWVTLDLLRSLSRLGQGEDAWQSLEPRTPFQPYRKKIRRY